MPPKIPIWNQRMMLLMAHCVDTGKVEHSTAFMESIGFEPKNISHVKTGRQNFTIAQMVSASKLYKVNLNWLAGLDQQMMRIPGKTALQRLKDAVRAVEAELT